MILLTCHVHCGVVVDALWQAGRGVLQAKRYTVGSSSPLLLVGYTIRISKDETWPEISRQTPSRTQRMIGRCAVLDSCQLIPCGRTTTRTKFNAIVNSEWPVNIFEGSDVQEAKGENG